MYNKKPDMGRDKYIKAPGYENKELGACKTRIHTIKSV